MYLGEYRIGDYIDIVATGHRFSSGAAYAASPITYTIYKDASATQIVTATAMTNFDSETGLYYDRVQLTSEKGFSNSSSYMVLIKATVDSVAAIDWRTFRIDDTRWKAEARVQCIQTQIINFLKQELDTILADTSEIQTKLPAGGASMHAAGAAVAKSPATLATADVTGNLPADIKAYTVQPTVTGATLHADYDAAKTASQAGDAMTLTASGIDAVFDRNSSLSISFENLINRIYQMLNNQMLVTEADGTVSLKAIGGASEIAAGDVESAAGTTTRAELTWA